VIYLYAITDASEAPLPAESGLEGASLFSLAYRDIAAVVSHLTAVKVPVLEANLWRHEAVVEALMAGRAVLPVRFGTLLADEAAVQAMLAAHYASFAADLHRLRGRVEVGLRVLCQADLRPAATERRSGQGSQGSAVSGRSFLLARLEEERQRQARHQRAENLAMQLHTPLAKLAVESTWQVLITPRLLLTAAYLVEYEQVATFRRQVEALSAAYPALRFLCTGPWPPYSFVTASRPQTAGDHRSMTGTEPC